MIQLHEIYEVIPIVLIAFAACAILLIEAFSKESKSVVYGFSIISIMGAIATSFLSLNKEVIVFNQFLKISNASIMFSVIILIGVLITVIASKNYLEKENINFGEFYSLVLFSLMGMMLMVFANDLLIIFIGLELMSVCFYVLAGFLRLRKKSNESALKYFLLGAFITGFILYGIALIYGITGTTNLTRIFADNKIFSNYVFIIGYALFLIGFLFKIGVFPFHMWIPDVYDGAPTIVSGMLSTAGKIAAVGTVLPIILTVNIVSFKLIFSVAAVATMMYGNIIALAQTNIKRLLAYSSIASAGYIFVGVAAMNEFALKGIAYYLIAYTFMQLGAFIIVSILEKKDDGSREYKYVDLDFYKGLGKRNPVLATFLTIFLFSLAGIPPFAGFWGKYYLFYAAIQANLIWLSVIGILLSLIGVYYYLKITVYMWFSESTEELMAEYEKVPVSRSGIFATSLAVIGTIVFGLDPNLFFRIFKMIAE
ncbi:MAG TPA: NADH-quinone oxidoreductase subunit N [Ignavibacteria bacterium]|nr:NADH-quinone oxidoreductase subunit N [Ignavibacteria bacterium]HQY51987.1 NADH-quinone oxidoreductase subunit N [Ignavibacteria bacterium]HRB00501.1 NADH-quinone oxidoreductase subunit N [Ignavibacteria bacterium]